MSWLRRWLGWWDRNPTNNPLPVEPDWPADAARSGPVIVLVDASSRLEQGLLAAWTERHAPLDTQVEVMRVAPSRRRRPRQRTDPGLEARLRSNADDPYVLPIRVVWSPFLRRGRRTANWFDVLRLGDPRDPDAFRQRVILATWPDRAAIVTGPGAPASRLIDDHQAAVEVSSLTDFVTRRAWLALEKAERNLRGNRYKVPRFLNDEITSRAEFGEGAMVNGAKRGLNAEVSFARARHYLKEIAAQHSPFLIDLIANAIHWLYRQGYGGLIYDRERVAEIAAVGQEVPLAFLPSHRSNLDRLALQYLKWENDLPPNHTAGGINMNFFPIGPLVRRTGVFFIRRSFKDNDLYKFVLRTYLDYLVENRFPLEWYMEGGRSRSGKLLPPKLGLLSYAVESWQRGKAEDLMLVPVSIVYDQIQDLSSYASEARGSGKEKESLAWVLGAIRSLRRRYGNIHIRFGEPISVAKALAGTELSEDSIDLAKVGFEVMYRISQVTPITPAAVVSIALLSAGGKAQTTAELATTCAALDRFIEEQELPTTEPLRLEDAAEVGRVLGLLAEHGNVSTHQGVNEVFYLQGDQALRASYYRNVVVHHFVPRGIAELAVAASRKPETFWETVTELRDLLKFEFFFPDKDAFREMVRHDLDRAVPGWEKQLTKTKTLLAGMQPKVARWAVMPMLESYLVVADELEARPGAADEKTIVAACMRRGEEYRLKRKIAADSVSAVAFKQALALAANRGLLEEGTAGARARFASEIAAVVARASDL
ncbi:MAG: 1-acyl-sn-glycerol-3-phosphate acyltransferase [Acidimicrobiia bacterium]